MKHTLTYKLLLSTLLVLTLPVLAGHIEISNQTSHPLVVNCSSAAPINIKPNYKSTVMYHHLGDIHCMAMSHNDMVDSRNFLFSSQGNENYMWNIMPQQIISSSRTVSPAPAQLGQVVSHSPAQSGQTMSYSPPQSTGISTQSQSLAPPIKWSYCAKEGGNCQFSGEKTVRYGASDSYTYKRILGGTPCSNKVFGDPIKGTVKECHASSALINNVGGTVTTINEIDSDVFHGE